MRRFACLLTVLLPLALHMSGCASQSELTAIRLDPDHPRYKSVGCQQSLPAGELHRDVKTASMLASPVLLFLSGGLLLPVVAANAGLDAADRVDASNMASNCGSRGQNPAEIATDVAIGATLGAAAALPAR